MPRNLNDMVVIITGASAGIGRALAVELSARGAKLSLAARRLDRLEELRGKLAGDPLIVATDVSKEEDCRRLIDRTIEKFGRIDTLVCNAGYGFLSPVAQTTREQLQQIFATNVLGTTDCIYFATPHMLKQELRDGWRGQVMMVSSVVARRGLPFFGAYSATKAAQLSLGEAMRVELQPQKIAVTTVHPAGTDTEFGDVSANLSAGKRPRRVSGEPRQSAQVVAQKMVRAIQRPKPEVWPFRPARWFFTLGAMTPGLVDRVLNKRRDLIGGASAQA
ncbi:MAG TPA: SDR family NAD(P)-dependent oxidoreductase [Humisphaera sp.]|jgi:NAD(P)-dependent dehydrogenase (short-subunit alcohol dehydrogenase family)|nr:SDR family NAD(P)-dependent oxidoreductase [Humisphaera sp.]